MTATIDRELVTERTILNESALSAPVTQPPDPITQEVTELKHTIAQTAAHLARLDRFLSETFDGLAEIDFETLAFISLDPKAQNLFNLRGQVVTKHNLRDFLEPGITEHLSQLGAMIVAGEMERSAQEAIIKRVDGSTREVLLRLMVAPDHSTSTASSDAPALPTLRLLITDQTKTHQLEAEYKRLKTVVNTAIDAIVIMDSSHSFLFTNPAFSKLSGYTVDECVGFRPDILRPLLEEPTLWTAVGDGLRWTGMIKGVNRKGEPLELFGSLSPVLETEKEIPIFVLILHDLTETHEAQSELAKERTAHNQLALTLSGLSEHSPAKQIALALTRAALSDSAVRAAVVLDLSLATETSADAKELAAAKGLADPRESSDSKGSVLAISPEGGFDLLAHYLSTPKKVKALLSHKTQSSWLEATAALVDASAGPAQGTAQGLGFNLDHAATLLLLPLRVNDQMLSLLAVVGDKNLAEKAAVLGELAASAGGLLLPNLLQNREANQARAALGEIINGRHFRPIFQPIIALADGGTIGWEASTRFEDGCSPPERFAQAVQVDLTRELETAAIIAAVKEAKLNNLQGGWLSLNISPEFFLTGDTLLNLLPGPDQPVVLALTSAPEPSPQVQSLIARLPAHIKLAVDSSSKEMHTLHAVVDLHPTYIKLPKDLIRGIDTDHVRQALVTGLGYFARSTNSELIADGVETEGEFNTLAKLKVAYAQGNYLGQSGFLPLAG